MRVDNRADSHNPKSARPERLVYDHVSGPVFRATVTLAPEGLKLRSTMRMLFATAELPDQVAGEFGAVEGLSQTLGRLVAELAKR